MVRRPHVKAKAIEAVRILNEFIGDLVVGTRSLELFESPAISSRIKPNTGLALWRMCLSHLVITLSKWAELYDRYKAIIPRDARQACEDLRNEINMRGIQKFRNTIVGHIWDKRLRRPLTRSEVDTRLATVLGQSQESFVKWINDPKNNIFPNTVVSICTYTRDRIQTEHSLKNSDIFP